MLQDKEVLGLGFFLLFFKGRGGGGVTDNHSQQTRILKTILIAGKKERLCDYD